MSATRAQDRRGAEAMSRDIGARFPKRDPFIERLEASRDIAHAERDKALALVAELTAELKRARRCLASSRLSHELAVQQWAQERESLQYRIDFADGTIRKLRKNQPAVPGDHWFKVSQRARDERSLACSYDLTEPETIPEPVSVRSTAIVEHAPTLCW